MSTSYYNAPSRPRVHVKVRADFSPEGKVVPLMFKGPDGETHRIDRILDVRTSPSYQGGGIGVRYTIRVEDQRLFLFNDRNFWWLDTVDSF